MIDHFRPCLMQTEKTMDELTLIYECKTPLEILKVVKPGVGLNTVEILLGEASLAAEPTSE